VQDQKTGVSLEVSLLEVESSNVGRAESFVKKDETRRQRIEQGIDPGGPRSVVAVYVDADVTEHVRPFDLMAGFASLYPPYNCYDLVGSECCMAVKRKSRANPCLSLSSQ
jgi:hypothetical protein